MKIKEDKLKEYNNFVETNRKDGYSYAVVRCMNIWADMMERRIEQGESLEDIAWDTFLRADRIVGGTTGYQYGWIVYGLAKYWEYGDALNKWHNKKYGYKGEGTVNPAIMVV